jgi:hypothetical protein
MSRNTFLKTFLFALTLLVSNVVWGVETILSNIASSATANWTFTNNVTTQAIQQGGYWLLQATGSAKDEIISEAINVSSYSNLVLTFDVATYGSGTNNPALIEISSDGGSTWSTTTYTSATPTSSTFITSGNINLGTINSTNLKIRFNNAGTADKGVRMKNILLKGDLAPSNTVSTPSITATGALNTTDNYFNTASITLSSTTSGASIYYTTNGDVPTAASTLYGAPFDITSTTTIKAIATKSGMDNSNVASKTITITTVSAPTITVTQVSVPDMTAVTGLSDSEILTVTGAVLNADVAISIDGTNASMFSISPESLTNTNGSASGSVTVTYSPTAPGTHTATLRFNSAGATEVTRTLNGTSAMATPVATDATGISTTGFTANWNAVVGASEYELSVYTKSSGSSNAPSNIFSENFDGFTGGAIGSGASTSDVSSSLDTYTQTAGWTGSKVYQAGGTVKMGSSSILGYITTPALNLSASNLTLSFKTMAWAGDAAEMKIYLDDVLLYTATGLNNTDYTLTPFSAALTGGTATSKIKFEGNLAAKGRFFLEDVSISGNSSTSTPISGSPFTIIGGNSKVLTELEENTTYYYKVIAKNGSTVTAASNEMSVITSNSTGLNNTVKNLQLRTINGNIVFNTSAGKLVNVYNSVGQRVSTAITTEGNNTIPTRVRGVVFVKIGSEILKLIVE